MKLQVAVQTKGNVKGDQILDVITRLGRDAGAESLRVGVAYASVSGLRALLAALPTASRSQWIVGLDDSLTHPSVFDVLASLPASEIRVAGELVDGCRFHPKVYAAETAGGHRSWLLAGSANLTLSGLSTNAEAVIALRAENRSEVSQIKDTWSSVWAAGRHPAKSLLSAYRKEFERLLPSRRPTGPWRNQVLEHDWATIDPGVANTVWIELGNITGFRSEQLEIKAEQALFFGLPMHGGPDGQVSVLLRSGQQVEIPVRYRDNAMWRFNLPVSIPEVARGLRPGGSRSPYVAVFSRRGSQIDLRFLRINSADAARLRKRSEQRGTLGRTTAREYGWY